MNQKRLPSFSRIFDLDFCLLDTPSMKPGLVPVLEKVLREGGCGDAEVPILIDALWSMPLAEVVKKRGLSAPLASELKRVNENLPIPPETRLYEDVLPVFEELRRQEGLNFLVTKGLQGYQGRKLDHLGIRAYFARIDIVGEENLFGTKLDAIQHIMMEHDLDPSSVHIIGDGHEELTAAHTIGARSIQTLRPGVVRLPAHHHVRHLGDILDLSLL